ncbi:MAG: DUF5985 family protein [Candidatus Tyrphobacter sp.]
MYELLSGIMAALCLVAGAHFLRSFLRTRDRLFASFSVAFFTLGCSQLFLGIFDQPEANHPLAYIPRLIAFVLIAAAILDKNRFASKGARRLRLVKSATHFNPLPADSKREGVS